jgi:sulfur carrier protein
MTAAADSAIRVQLNGESVEVRDGLTLGGFLESHGVNRRMVAVEYNGEILPRHAWDETTIHDGDLLEVVQMVGGG